VSTPFAHLGMRPSYMVPARARVQFPCQPARHRQAPAPQGLAKAIPRPSSGAYRALPLNRQPKELAVGFRRRRKVHPQAGPVAALRPFFLNNNGRSPSAFVGSSHKIAKPFHSPFRHPVHNDAQQNGLLPLHPKARKSSWPGAQVGGLVVGGGSF
jgi:hypothetical protein